MELKEIKEKSCKCGAMIVEETRDRVHTNGHYNETRKFSCGHALRFSPNYMETIIMFECPNSSAEKKKEKLIKKLKKDIEDVVKKSKVSNAVKDGFMSAIRYIT